MRKLILAACAAVIAVQGMVAAQERKAPKMWLDPVTRYIHVTYQVPTSAPDEVQVVCSWSPAGKDDWHSAGVTPFISETGLRMTPNADVEQWAHGRVTERRAAGLERTVVFNPYPKAQVQGKVNADFRIRIEKPSGELISEQTAHIQADNSDVVYIEDWSKVLQMDVISTEPTDGKWLWNTKKDGVSQANSLTGKAGTPLPSLTYPLNLRGNYAIFVCTDPEAGSIGLRLTGDERTEYVRSSAFTDEILWRWTRMDHQHLVLKQKYSYTGYADASMDYVKLVPLTTEAFQKLDGQYTGKHDKFLSAYFEPYTWAFYNNITETYQHREPMSAYAEAGVDMVDIQIGRFGMKVVYETRKSDQLIYSTEGDPIGDTIPKTDNVGRMQQFTNALQSEVKYAREMGVKPHANFGATNCYPGSPLEGDISRLHPDWRRGSALRYELPEVRAYILSLYREALELGAPGISIDYCRYPEGIDSMGTCTQFMRELRKLADEFGKARGTHVTINVRFPATGVRQCKDFDYRTWAREGLVDYLCPSNIQGRHLSFDITPYLEAVKGTKCKLTPVVDALEWGLTMPGPFLWRVKQLFDQGADGVYIYQADDPVVYKPVNRRYIRMMNSTDAVDRWWQKDAADRPKCSKGIYITPPSDGRSYNSWERLRVWLEGIPMGEVQMFLDGKLVSKYQKPPYLLGTEEYESDKVVPAGEHTLMIRAKDGDGWLEQRFTIKGAQ